MQFSKETDQHNSDALPVIDSRLAELGEATHAIRSALGPLVESTTPKTESVQASAPIAHAVQTEVAPSVITPQPVVSPQTNLETQAPLTSSPVNPEELTVVSARQQVSGAYEDYGQAA